MSTAPPIQKWYPRLVKQPWDVQEAHRQAWEFLYSLQDKINQATASIPSPGPTIEQIRNELQASGSAPLNATGLAGIAPTGPTVKIPLGSLTSVLGTSGEVTVTTAGSVATISLPATITSAENFTGGLESGGVNVATVPVAWSGYSPTITADTGTVTTSLVLFRYTQSGKNLIIRGQINCTFSLAATILYVTLPVSAKDSNQGIWAMIQDATTGAVLGAGAYLNTVTQVKMFLFSGVLFNATDTYVVIFGGVLESA